MKIIVLFSPQKWGGGTPPLIEIGKNFSELRNRQLGRLIAEFTPTGSSSSIIIDKDLNNKPFLLKDYFICVQHNIPLGYIYGYSSQQIVIQAVNTSNERITIATSKPYYTATDDAVDEGLKTLMLYGNCIGTYANITWEGRTASYLTPSDSVFGGYNEKLGDWPPKYYPSDSSSIAEYNSLICNRLLNDSEPIKSFKLYIQGNHIGGPQTWYIISPEYYFRWYIFGIDY